MVTLTWTREKAGSWGLKADTGPAWATVERDGKRYRATCLNDEMPSRYGRFWVLGSTVQSARTRIEHWLYRNACAVENFKIT